MILRIYYDNATGDVFFVNNMYKRTDTERDLQVFIQLTERNRETFDYIEIEQMDYQQDFAECNGYRINPETKVIEFSYPDPNEPEAPQEYKPPLSEEVEQLKQRQDATENAVLDLLLMGGM